MTPSVPSEPQRKRSGDGPAPEAGRRRVSSTPRGVTARSPWTNSSMWVKSVAKWPPERVAIQPPSVDHSKACGKWRSVSPWGFSWASSDGPSVPPWIRAERDAASTSSTRSSRPRSIETAPR